MTTAAEIIHCIYALCDPLTGEIRYIGKSKHPRRRLQEHRLAVVNGSQLPVHHWMRKLAADGLEPTLDILEAVPVGHINNTERRLISYWRDILGKRLLNVSRGGDGGALPPALAKAAGVKRRGSKRTNAQRHNQSVAALRRCESPMERERLRALGILNKGSLRHAPGALNNAAVLTEAMVVEMRSMAHEKVTLDDIGAHFGINRVTVWQAVTGNTWSHVSAPIKAAVPKLKLTNADVAEIKRRVLAGETQTAVAAAFGVRQSHISNIVRGLARKRSA